MTDFAPVSLHPTPPARFRTFVEPPAVFGGDGRAAVFCPVSGRAAVLDPADLDLLGVCRQPAPLDLLARRGCLALDQSLDQHAWVRGRRGRLVAAGLLLSDADVLDLLAAGGHSRPVPITVVGIPTRDRPHLLARCVANLVAGCRAGLREVELVVADGSASVEMQAANRRVLADLADRFPGPICYYGPAERELFVADLARAGADPEVVRLAITPDPGLFAAGAGRNLLCLYAAGRGLLMLDDDVQCRLHPVPGADPHLVLTAAGDPTEFWYGVDDADAALGPPADLLAAHEALLGRGLADLLAGGDADADGVDALFLRRVRAAGGRVRLTTAGVAGDSGMGTTLYHLLVRGPSRERLHASEATYRAALAGGPVLRAVTRPTVTAGSVCMGLNLALDLRDPLPPFPPALRNEDGAFGAAVQGCCPGALMGHLPAAVWHRPDGSRVPVSPAAAVAGVRPDQFVPYFVRACSPPAATADVRRNLRLLGEGLEAVAGQPAGDFGRVLQAAGWEVGAGTAAGLTAARDEHPDAPGYWAEDVGRLADRTRDAVAGAGAAAPADGVREVLGRYGRVLNRWPDLAGAAAGLPA